MTEHGIWTTEGYLGAGLGLESRKETSRGKRCFKGHGSGVGGDMLYERGRKDSGRQRTEGWGRTWGQKSTGAIFNAVMKPYTWHANF